MHLWACQNGPARSIILQKLLRPSSPPINTRKSVGGETGGGKLKFLFLSSLDVRRTSKPHTRPRTFRKKLHEDVFQALGVVREPAPKPAGAHPPERRRLPPPQIRAPVRRPVRPVPRPGHQGGTGAAAAGGGGRPQSAPEARHGSLHEAPVPPRRRPGNTDAIQKLPF